MSFAREQLPDTASYFAEHGLILTGLVVW